MKNFLLLSIAPLCLLVGSIPLSAATYTFTSINYPGATTTVASGINNSGQICGYYHDQAGHVHGFLKSGNNFTSFDVPNSTDTEGQGLNTSAQVVGGYNHGHAFVKNGANFTTIDVPGATDTTAAGINGSGQIVGFYSNNGTHGFLNNANTITTIDVPGASLTEAIGINSSGQIVGEFRTSTTHAFAMLPNLTTFDVPGSTSTGATGINSFGHIVGSFFDQNGKDHGFVDVSNQFTTIDYPNATKTEVIGINDSGQLVGFYIDSLLKIHGFLAVPTSRVIHVPADQPTIQAGIDAADNGYTVLVSPGTYIENIDFKGKAITVKSSNGAARTIIDGSQSGSVVTFSTGEGNASLLSGFTIRNGQVSAGLGGGVTVTRTSPTITNNVITNNGACSGDGIYVDNGSPIITHNTISNNTETTCSGGMGGGIAVNGENSSPHILNNVISGNLASQGNFGGGISLFDIGATVVQNNLIINNTVNGTSDSVGGGIFVYNGQNTLIVQNVFAHNHADDGGGIYFSNPPGVVTANIVYGNTATNRTSGIYIGGLFNGAFENNIVVSQPGQTAIYCVTELAGTIKDNDVLSVNGIRYGGTCTDRTGTNGNISSDPKFVNPTSNNFRLLGGSPVVDAGDNSAPNLPSTDFAGNPRIVNGYDGPSAVVDMGAYEFIPVVLSPTTLGFGTHPIGSHTPKTVKLTNNLNQTLSITSIATTGDYSYSSTCGSTVPPMTSCNITVTFTPTQVGIRRGTLTITDVAGNSPQIVSLTGTGQ